MGLGETGCRSTGVFEEAVGKWPSRSPIPSPHRREIAARRRQARASRGHGIQHRRFIQQSTRIERAVFGVVVAKDRIIEIDP